MIAIQRYYNYAENKVLIPTPTYYFGQSRVNIGKVYMKEDGYIRVARDVENIEDQSLDTLFIQNKNLIIYEVVNNKLIVESAKYEDIMDYIHCGDDATDVAIHTRYGDYKSMFFIKGRPQGEQSGGDDPGEPISQDGPYKITTAARVGVKDGVGTVAINQVEDQIGRRSGFDETYAKLYYKADLSKITNPVSKAVLKFNAKAFTAITLSIYAVEEDWDETISVENQPQLGSLIAQENLLAYVDGGYNYLVREIDITAYVQELQANNNMHVNIMLDPVHYNTSHPADNRILITGVTGGSYPYIEIETEEINPD